MNQLTLFDFKTPTMPTLDVSRCHVRPVNYQTASSMVTQYHYAHRTPSIVAAFGLYVDNVLAGVITYGIPPNRNVLLCCGDDYEKNALELNRVFIHDWAGKNSESWLIGQSFKLLQQLYPEILILVSYADTAQGHAGMIYRATNWLYTGLSNSSAASDAIVNGKKMSTKDMFNMYGTHQIVKLNGMGVDVVKIPPSAKHRYVYFLGDKRQRKTLRAALKWDVLPYPKVIPVAVRDTSLEIIETDEFNYEWLYNLRRLQEIQTLGKVIQYSLESEKKIA